MGRVLSRAWREKVAYAPELDELDRPDFLTYVGVMKANLWYADLARADLPPAALALAAQAPAPPGFPWYRDLYGLYERVRSQERVLTFDDMLLSGWECLHRFPDVLAEARRRFRCVLVDEFQDVNRVQSEILDLLTGPDRNYMGIGDDDQTIYEWRGADPSLILSFAGRYGAARYFIRDNFRSHAAPLALANRVIERNRKREPKRLSLTRGFDGDVQVHTEDSPEKQGRHVAALVREALGVGASGVRGRHPGPAVRPDPLLGAGASGGGRALPGRRQQPVLRPPRGPDPAGLPAAGTGDGGPRIGGGGYGLIRLGNALAPGCQQAHSLPLARRLRGHRPLRPARRLARRGIDRSGQGRPRPPGVAPVGPGPDT